MNGSAKISGVFWLVQVLALAPQEMTRYCGREVHAGKPWAGDGCLVWAVSAMDEP